MNTRRSTRTTPLIIRNAVLDSSHLDSPCPLFLRRSPDLPPNLVMCNNTQEFFCAQRFFKWKNSWRHGDWAHCTRLVQCNSRWKGHNRARLGTLSKKKPPEKGDRKDLTCSYKKETKILNGACLLPSDARMGNLYCRPKGTIS